MEIFMQRIILLFLAFSAMAPPCHADEPQKKRPNIVFLLSGRSAYWNVLGCTGDKLAQTPNLDALAKRGVRFRNHFVTTSICAVSRASILSGQYARRHKINDFATSFTPDAFVLTYPMLLRRAGYRVGFIGKFGVGNAMPEKAFDYWRGFPGQGSYFTTKRTPSISPSAWAIRRLEFSLQGCSQDAAVLPVAQLQMPARDGCGQTRVSARSVLATRTCSRMSTFPVPKTAADPKYFEALPDFVQKSEGRTRWQRRFKTPEMYQTILRDYYRFKVTGMDR